MVKPPDAVPTVAGVLLGRSDLRSLRAGLRRMALDGGGMNGKNPLDNVHLANKLAALQGQLASTSVTLPGSHPHPRRVLKETAKRGLPEYLTGPDVDEAIEELEQHAKTSKPRNVRRSRKEDQVSPRRRKVAKASGGGSDGNGGSGQTDAGGELYSGQEETLK